MNTFRAIEPADHSAPIGVNGAIVLGQQAGRDLSPQRIMLLQGTQHSSSHAPFFPGSESSRKYVYPCEKAELWHDWSVDRNILSELRSCNAVVLRDFSLPELDSLFRLRALQLLASQPCLDIPSIVFISKLESDSIVPGLRRRMVASWPFRSALFVADGATATALRNENLPVIASADAARMTLAELSGHPDALMCRATADQSIGLHIQPLWGRCGSSTAFANEIDCLLDRNLFAIRIFIDPDRRFGGTTRRALARMLPQNLLDSGPCLESVACWQPDSVWGLVARRQTSLLHLQRRRVSQFFPRIHAAKRAANDYEEFYETVRKRTQATLRDDVVIALASRAEVAIVNHAFNLGFAARVAPSAKLILDTHDYLTRGAVERARTAKNSKAFPDCATLRRHLALEHHLWQAADVCTAVSPSEAACIERHAAHSLLVLPEPYVKPWRDPGSAAQWDFLIVADNHFFNIDSVAWFLERVVLPNAQLRALRIAVVGKVCASLERDWSPRLSNVNWLGFVRDLDQTRNQSRLAVCPDRAGTGISVKALSAIAAGQPIVASSVALRGLPSAVTDLIPFSDTGEGMASDILDLLNHPGRLALRQKSIVHAYGVLKNNGSYAAAIGLAGARPEKVTRARRGLLAEFGGSTAVQASSEPGSSVAPALESIELHSSGNAAPFLGPGWHEPESWGRFMDGNFALLCLPVVWSARRATIEIQFLDIKPSTGVRIGCRGRTLSPPGFSTSDRSMRFKLDGSMVNDAGDHVTLDFQADSTFCPHDHDGSSDERVLGAGVKSVKVLLSRLERLERRVMSLLDPERKRRGNDSPCP
jgi:hypothetical protein